MRACVWGMALGATLGVRCQHDTAVGACIMAEGSANETVAYYYDGSFSAKSCADGGGRWQSLP